MTVPSVANYAFPFRWDAAAGRTAQAGYADHVEQMIKQVLLTDPGERADLPSFGCGLRALVFAPLSVGLVASGKIVVRQALERWMAGTISVVDVAVDAEDRGGTALVITINYTLLETQSVTTAQVTLI